MNAVDIIKNYYKEILITLKQAKKDYNENKRSFSKRQTFQFVAAQEMRINELCIELGIDLDSVIEDFNKEDINGNIL